MKNKPWKELGITQALYYIQKRQSKPSEPVSYGCVICCQPKKSKGMCNKHYQRYYRSEIKKRERKGLV